MLCSELYKNGIFLHEWDRKSRQMGLVGSSSLLLFVPKSSHQLVQKHRGWAYLEKEFSVGSLRVLRRGICHLDTIYTNEVPTGSGISFNVFWDSRSSRLLLINFLNSYSGRFHCRYHRTIRRGAQMKPAAGIFTCFIFTIILYFSATRRPQPCQPWDQQASNHTSSSESTFLELEVLTPQNQLRIHWSPASLQLPQARWITG